MKINFKQFKVYTNISKTESATIDASKDLADGIYKSAQGIAAHALALKVFNSDEVDYDESEMSIIDTYANQYCTPFFIESLKIIKDESSTETTESNKVAE